MEDKQLSSRESLQIIQQMIDAAKQEQKDDGLGWIVWGWLLFLTSILTWINLYTGWFSTFIFWTAAGIVTLLARLFEMARKQFFPKKEIVRTYTRDLFEKLNTGFFIMLLLIIVAMNMNVDPKKGFALLIGIYGFWMLIYGSVFTFRPSVIGAFVTWAFGLSALFVRSFEWTMILHAAAVLCGYIIPGYIARKEFKKLSLVKS
jgi:MFS family permease